MSEMMKTANQRIWSPRAVDEFSEKREFVSQTLVILIKLKDRSICSYEKRTEHLLLF